MAAASKRKMIPTAIAGSITDPQNAPIANAAVAVRDIERGTVWPTQTDSDGVYVLPSLPLGKYQVSVEAKGFAKSVNPKVELELGKIARADFQMKIGQPTTIIEVTSAAPLLQTENATVGNVMESHQASNLPLATRNYNQLTLLTPGTVAPGSLFQYRVFAKMHGHDFALVDASQPLQAESTVRLVVEPSVNGQLAVMGSGGKRLFDQSVLANAQYAISPRKGETMLHIVFTPAASSAQAHPARISASASAPVKTTGVAGKALAPVTADIHLIYR
ncbi:MAG: carboxypeptidase-like regulatory domain-containing protein [Bryobacteraceae bacterium]